MQLLGSLTSPYTRKVQIVLAEKRIESDFVLDLPWTPEARTPHFNPLGKVPVLVLDDGSSLFDSRVIVEYLDTLAPQPPIYGATSAERIQVKRWEALTDGLSDAAAAIVIENRRVPAERSAAWIARQESKVHAALKEMARQLGDSPWCVASGYSLADINLGCALGFLAFRLPQVEWRNTYPNLAVLFDTLSQQEAFINTVPHD